MLKNTSSELITCSLCGYEKELYYDDEDRVTSELSCKCRKKVKLINGMKLLDWAILQLDKEFLKNKRGIK
jgi:hypothetical protein